ncbi:MAG: VWA domain-containing protein [Ruminococcus sp.]|nr:VWA domain-containing protein [Ruminococcus sp.]
MSRDNKIRKPRPRGSRFLSVVLVAVLAASTVINSYFTYDLFGRGIQSSEIETVAEEDKEAVELKKTLKETRDKLAQEDEQERVNGDKGFDPLMLSELQEANEEAIKQGLEAVNTKIIDEYAAKQVLGALAYDLGIRDTESEYSFQRKAENQDFEYYTMKQSFNGIEIAGAGITMQVGKDDSELVNTSGKHFNIPEDIELDLVIGYDEAKQIASDYIKQAMRIPEDKQYLENRGQKIFVISTNVYASCYEIGCQLSDGREFIIAVDTVSGGIAKLFDNFKFVMTSTTLKGQLGDQSISVDMISETDHRLEDTERNIHIHVIEDRAATPVIKYEDMINIPVYSWDPTNKTPDRSGVDTLANIQKVYDFYKKTFDRDGVDGSYNHVNAYVGVSTVDYGDGDSSNMTNNAGMAGSSTLYIGTKSPNEYSSDLDVMGHEFTHGVIASGGAVRYAGKNSAMDAINEGFADIFGELIADFNADGELDGANSLSTPDTDWDIVGRVFSDPKLKNCADFEEGVTDCHEGGTLVNGLFYRMMTDAKPSYINVSVLANLYYSIIPMFNNSTDFKELRTLIENQALKWNAETNAGTAGDRHVLTDDMVETIIDAFDYFNYPETHKYRVVKGGKVIVYDKDEDPYDNYHIAFARPYDKSQVVFETDVSEKEFVIPGEIPNGYYSVTVTDLANPKNKVRGWILINDNAADQKCREYPEKVEIFTNFNSEAREVVLVIDDSGSMDGSPIEQARSSAVNFVNTVLNSNPATSISLISYNSSFTTRVSASSNKNQLVSSIQSIRSGGGTDTYDALAEAKRLLTGSKSQKRLVVLLSDGLPNEGPSDNGDYYAPIYRLMDEMKREGIIVYSLGFFHNLGSYELGQGQELMSKIATEGYDYVVDNADEAEGAVSDLELVFNDFAEMVNGKQYINIRIACPVDVTVNYNGETLSSDKKHPVTRTSFGTLSYEKVIDEETGEETDDPVKILRLEKGTDYEICINGTGKGKMNYTISYPDENGEYTDVREFKKVPVTKDTVIAASTKENSGKVDLKIDTDGDGKFDLNYEAEEGKKAEETSGDNTMTIIMVIANSVAGAAILAYLIVSLVKKKKQPKPAAPAAPTVCPGCSAPLTAGMKFCRNCGTPIPAPAPAPAAAPAVKAPKAGMIVKLVIIGLCVCVTAAAAGLYYSPATTVFKTLRDGQPESARLLYENSVEGSSLSEKYISVLLNNHLGKAEKAYNDGRYSAAEYRTLLEGVKALGVDDASDTAKDSLKELSKSGDESEAQEQSESTEAAESAEESTEE